MRFVEYWNRKNMASYLSKAVVGNPIRVAIVEDEAETGQAVRGWFKGTANLLIVGEVRSNEETLRYLEEVQPDVVLMDVAAASAAQVRQVAALAGVIVLHTAGQEPGVLEALRAGALGHLDRQNVRPSQALAAIRAVSRGQAVLSPSVAGRILDQVLERRRRGET